eukprot:899199-Pelagomonas_calceolata.AAC.1
MLIFHGAHPVLLGNLSKFAASLKIRPPGHNTHLQRNFRHNIAGTYLLLKCPLEASATPAAQAPLNCIKSQDTVEYLSVAF